jgi:hypothetical protein
VPDFLRGDESVGSAAAGAPPAPSATVDTALIDSLVGKHADGTPE